MSVHGKLEDALVSISIAARVDGVAG